MHLDRLTLPAGGTGPAQPRPVPGMVAEAVLKVLAGMPLDQAAAAIAMTKADLAEATVVYRAAGNAALEAQAENEWYHVSIQFNDWAAAERTVTADLAPRLRHLTETGMITGWWFLRKYPCWRLRLRPSPAIDPAEARAAVGAALENLRSTGGVECWWASRYEAEAFAFGGPLGMTAAHEHFCADSLGALNYLHQPDPGIGRRELSVLLCNTMFTATGLDWFEMGDVWNNVAGLRPPTARTDTNKHQALVAQLRALMAVNATPTGALFMAGTPVSFAADWAHAFDRAGRTLAALAAAGTLERGVRHILTHVIIFHWNRLGIFAEQQAILARAARDATLPKI